MSVFQRMGAIYLGAPGATVRQTRARSLAEHATANTTEEANDRCRTPDDSTAKDEYSDHNRTTPAIRQAPEWAPFTFLGLSCQLRRTAHGRFVEARPARPTSTRLRPRHARDAPSGGSIVAQTKTHTGPRGSLRGKIGGSMAHATKCAAPEGNRGRDEWMTVIEMQECLLASIRRQHPLSGIRPSHTVG